VTGWEDLARALSGHAPLRVSGGARRAAVALVFRDGQGDSSCSSSAGRSTRRTVVGMAPQSDEPDPTRATARETLEETGLDLAADGDPLGALDQVEALARGRPVDLVIAPFVHRLRRRLDGAPSLEVVSLHWLPLELLSPVPADLQHRSIDVLGCPACDRRPKIWG
jgi:8-oxo-dGTP pyrophosphatase MutT (NUDIX family)